MKVEFCQNSRENISKKQKRDFTKFCKNNNVEYGFYLGKNKSYFELSSETFINKNLIPKLYGERIMLFKILNPQDVQNLLQSDLNEKLESIQKNSLDVGSIVSLEKPVVLSMDHDHFDHSIEFGSISILMKKKNNHYYNKPKYISNNNNLLSQNLNEMSYYLKIHVNYNDSIYNELCELFDSLPPTTTFKNLFDNNHFQQISSISYRNTCRKVFDICSMLKLHVEIEKDHQCMDSHKYHILMAKPKIDNPLSCISLDNSNIQIVDHCSSSKLCKNKIVSCSHPADNVVVYKASPHLVQENCVTDVFPQQTIRNNCDANCLTTRFKRMYLDSGKSGVSINDLNEKKKYELAFLSEFNNNQFFQKSNNNTLFNEDNIKFIDLTNLATHVFNSGSINTSHY